VDEAGRGPLAGPVVAAAVILPAECCLPGVRDSKTLSPRQREHWYAEITRVATDFSLGVMDAAAIDRLNIREATYQAMRLAVAGLSLRPELALVDGLPVPGFPVAHEALVRGDARSPLIAAASIVAKVTRDRIMAAYAALYPGYGFADHKGYGTPAHLAYLRRQGPCPLHRRSFAPVAGAAAGAGARLF
jgi:ribonuclease HII